MHQRKGRGQRDIADYRSSGIFYSGNLDRVNVQYIL